MSEIDHTSDKAFFCALSFGAPEEVIPLQMAELKRLRAIEKAALEVTERASLRMDTNFHVRADVLGRLMKALKRQSPETTSSD